MMMNNKTTPAAIHATLALGSSVTAPYYDVNIEQQLCQCACQDERPVFAPSFSVSSIENVGTNQYLVYMHVEGVVSYVPCGCGTCCTRSQLISQDFTVPVYSTTEITGVTVTVGASSNSIVRVACKECSRTFVSDTPITLTFA